MSESTSLEFNLQPIDDDSFYQTSTNPDLIQRESIINSGERDSLVVQAHLVEVIHGTLSPNGNPASLIVTDFKFVSLKASRRFKSAVISYRFASKNPSSPDPEVRSIAPMGSISLKQSEKPIENLSRSVEVSLESRIPPVPGGVQVGLEATFSKLTETSMTVSGSVMNVASATLGYSWDVAEKKDRTSQARVAGIARREQRQDGEENTAVWSLTESGEKNGIPTFMRAAILLKRENNESFQATIEIKATADLAYSLKRMLGGTPKGHPVNFNPKIDRTGSGGIEGDIRHNLIKIDLERLSRIGTTTTSLQESRIGEGLKGEFR